MENNNSDFKDYSKQTLFEKFKAQCDYLGEQCGVNGKIILVLIIISLICVFIGYFDVYITNIVGIVYPVYWSIKALESKELDDDEQWLTYWVVFFFFVLIESIFSSFLKWIPFYFFIKLVFLLWLFLPNFRGANFVYEHGIRLCFKKYEVKIDEASNNFTDRLKEASRENSYLKVQHTNSIATLTEKI